MARNHAVQHRPGRESKQVELKNEMQELRAQNQKLRRENARLRRENEELWAREGVHDPLEAQLPPVETTAAKAANSCPNGCGVPLKVVSIPGKKLKVCPECHWRMVE